MESLLRISKVWVGGMTLIGGIVAALVKDSGAISLLIIGIVIGGMAPPIHMLWAVKGEGARCWQIAGIKTGVFFGLFNGTIWAATFEGRLPAQWTAIESATFFWPLVAAPLCGYIAGRLADNKLVIPSE